MNRFLKNIVLCGMPMLLFLIVIEVVVRSAPNDYKYKWSYLENHASNIEVLVLGNSHTAHGIDCLAISANTFNMAMGGQGVILDAYIIDRFVENMFGLKAVILPMTYPTLNMPEAYGAPDRLMQYHIYYDYDSKWYSIDNYECLNFITCSKKTKALIKGKSLIGADSLGFFRKRSGSFNDTSSDVVSWQTGSSPSLKRVNTANIERIIESCEDIGAKVILVSIPVDISFRENKYFNKDQIDLVKEVARGLYDGYSNVYWVDWFDNPNFDTPDFFDSDHLNEQGALKLTRMLNDFMIENGIL